MSSKRRPRLAVPPGIVPALHQQSLHVSREAGVELLGPARNELRGVRLHMLLGPPDLRG